MFTVLILAIYMFAVMISESVRLPFCYWRFVCFTCSAQLNRFHMKRRSRNTLIITIIIVLDN